MPGGKLQERRASHFSFFCVYDNPERRPTRALARVGLLLCFTFFGILTTKPPGRFWGAGFSLPLGEPRTFDAFLRQVIRGTRMRTPEKCVQL